MKLRFIPILLIGAGLVLSATACGGGSGIVDSPIQEVEVESGLEVETLLSGKRTAKLTSTPTVPLLSSATDFTGSLPSSKTLQAAAVVQSGVQVVLTEDSVARYLVQEQLAELDMPNDAIGSTDQVEGHITFRSDGTIEEDSSRISIDLRTLRSDKSRRDQYLSRNIFEAEKFPFAEFVVSEIRGLQWPLPTAGEFTFQLIGDMTIHGVTASLTWDVEVVIGPQEALGQATTSFPFHLFDMEIPSLFFILSVKDNIRLEVDLSLDIVTVR